MPRGEHILNWGVNMMRLHAYRKSTLEVEFIDDEGTGLVPTLEIFEADLGMWLSDGTEQTSAGQDMGGGRRS